MFVDQYSKYGYVHIQKTASAEETIEAKKVFENHLESMGVRVKSYQADNGVFRAHKWVDACRDKNQNLSFVGVNAHHQNGHAERRIRELQGIARTNILHAIKRWPKGITTNLWPYALRMASDSFNNSPNLQSSQKQTPLQIISGSDVDTNLKHYHSFGCPAYILSSELQQGKPFGKWKSRAEVGIYLGRSPHHNRNVGLILNRSTGLVSPQFHVKYDNNFDTVDEISAQEDWKVKAGFVRKISQSDMDERIKNRKSVRILTDMKRNNSPTLDDDDNNRKKSRLLESTHKPTDPKIVSNKMSESPDPM